MYYKTVYLFLQKPDTTEYEDIVPITARSISDYRFLNDNSWDVIDKYGGYIGNGVVQFKKSHNNFVISHFLEDLRNTINCNLYFAFKRGGNIWAVPKDNEIIN